MTNGISRYLKVGVAYEGQLDAEYVKTLISRILNDKGYGISDFDVVQVGTAITKYVPVYAARFSNNSRELAIFLTDSDGGTNTVGDIAEKIEQSNPELRSISAIGVADPHMESWVMADEDTVKGVFHLDAALPLPHSQMRPKDRLISILSTSSYEGTLDDAKITIASTANMTVMSRRCSDFSAFVRSINDALNYIESQQRLDI